MSVMSAMFWLKGWVGGFPPCFCLGAKFPAHSFSHPFAFLVKNEATPQALWRGVDGSFPNALWKKGADRFFVHVQLLFSRRCIFGNSDFRKNFLKIKTASFPSDNQSFEAVQSLKISLHSRRDENLIFNF